MLLELLNGLGMAAPWGYRMGRSYLRNVRSPDVKRTNDDYSDVPDGDHSCCEAEGEHRELLEESDYTEDAQDTSHQIPLINVTEPISGRGDSWYRVLLQAAFLCRMAILTGWGRYE